MAESETQLKVKPASRTSEKFKVPIAEWNAHSADFWRTGHNTLQQFEAFGVPAASFSANDIAIATSVPHHDGKAITKKFPKTLTASTPRHKFNLGQPKPLGDNGVSIDVQPMTNEEKRTAADDIRQATQILQLYSDCMTIMEDPDFINSRPGIDNRSGQHTITPGKDLSLVTIVDDDGRLIQIHSRPVETKGGKKYLPERVTKISGQETEGKPTKLLEADLLTVREFAVKALEKKATSRLLAKLDKLL